MTWYTVHTSLYASAFLAISTWFSSHSYLSFWALHFSPQACPYMPRNLLHGQKNFIVMCGVAASFPWWDPTCGLQAGFPQLLLVSENFFTCLFHSFLHFIPPLCGTRCTVSKSGKSIQEHCLKSHLNGWVLKLTCVKLPDYLIALLESFQFDLYFGNHQSMVTADTCSTVDS